MGLFDGLGNKQAYKAQLKCSNRSHGKVALIKVNTEKFGGIQAVEDYAYNHLKTGGCEKCTLVIDELSAEEYKSAKKIYDVIEL